jgi:hypothetical protein
MVPPGQTPARAFVKVLKLVGPPAVPLEVTETGLAQPAGVLVGVPVIVLVAVFVAVEVMVGVGVNVPVEVIVGVGVLVFTTQIGIASSLFEKGLKRPVAPPMA